MTRLSLPIAVRNSVVAAILVAVAVVFLAACGGSGSSATSETASKAVVVGSADRVSDSTSAPSRARFPDGEENDEVSPTGAGPVKPCSFVSAEEASAIVGVPVKASTGAQGPTCIYEAPGTKRLITLVVERVSLASLRNHASAATRVAAAGRDGWCLRYASTSVVVPLAEGNVLNVTGPCGIATRFAARAIPRIAS
jgi:hypothetical protein